MPDQEQTFFADPALDRLWAVTLALAAEVFVLRSQVRRLSGASGEKTGDEAAEDAEAFVRHLLSSSLGEPGREG